MRREKINLENLALAGELAQQLRHDIGNFINHVFLKMELAEVSLTSSKAIDWSYIREEGNNLRRRMQEWDRFHLRFSLEPEKVDLHQILRQVATEVEALDSRVQVEVDFPFGPLLVMSVPSTLKHLFRFLVEDFLKLHEIPTGNIPKVLLQTVRTESENILRISARLPFSPKAESAQSEKKSQEGYSTLVAACCRSMAMLLDVTLQRDYLPQGQELIQVKFPQEQFAELK